MHGLIVQVLRPDLVLTVPDDPHAAEAELPEKPSGGTVVSVFCQLAALKHASTQTTDGLWLAAMFPSGSGGSSNQWSVVIVEIQLC